MVAAETQLIEHSSVEAMVEAYREACDEIRRGFGLLESAERRLCAAFSSESSYRFAVNRDRHHFGGVGIEAAERNIARLHKAAIHAIIEKLGIRPTLSEKRWRELERQIEEDHDLPEISIDGVQAMVEGIAGNLSTYFAEAVDEVYEFLRPRRSQYKTNSEYEVPRRVIVHCIARGYGGKPFRPADYYQQQILALDSVFHYLDGKKAPGTYYGKLGEAIIESPDGTGETEYFSFRCYRNGNLHLTFRRLDLLAALNAAAGGRRLRSAA